MVTRFSLGPGNGDVHPALLWLNDNGEEVAFFRRKVTINGASATTPQYILTDDEVPPGFVPIILGFFGKVHGATSWTNGLKVEDTDGTDLVTFGFAALSGNARITMASANVTIEDGMILGTGGNAGKGLKLSATAAAPGSDFVLTVWGLLIKAS